MANPTATANAKKTGKPRKKAELAHCKQIGCEQVHCEQAGPAQAKPLQSKPGQAGDNQAINPQSAPQGEVKAKLEDNSEFGMGAASIQASTTHAEKGMGQKLSSQKSGQTRKTINQASSNDLGQKPGYNEAMPSMKSGRKTAASSAPKPKAASAFGPVSDQTPAFNSQKDTLVLTNCTNSPRGIAFKNGIVILQPREMRVVPADQQQEVRDLFKNPTFQRFVDHVIFRLSSIGDDEQSIVVKTPPRPKP